MQREATAFPKEQQHRAIGVPPFHPSTFQKTPTQKPVTALCPGVGGVVMRTRTVSTSRSIYIGNLPVNATQEQLHEYLASFGTITDLHLRSKRYPPRT